MIAGRAARSYNLKECAEREPADGEAQIGFAQPQGQDRRLTSNLPFDLSDFRAQTPSADPGHRFRNIHRRVGFEELA